MIPKAFDLSNWKDEDGIILTKKGKSTEKNVLLGNKDLILDLFNIEALSRSVVSDSLGPFGLWPSQLFCPWDFPGNTGVGCHFLKIKCQLSC